MTDKKWKTSITDASPEKIRIRGYSITEIMEKLSYAEVVWLVLTGELPTKAQAEVFNAILVSTVDHGPTPPSVLATRTVVSGGNSINAAIAGGVLAIGDTHGGAIERSAKILQEWAVRGDNCDVVAANLVDWLDETGTRMPGFGHQLHSEDPRTGKLFALAERNGLSGKHIELCRAIGKALEKKSGRRLPININGAVAAVISDMGLDYRFGKGIFIVSRVPGLLAHAYEELTREKPMRKLGPMPFEYDGSEDRDL